MSTNLELNSELDSEPEPLLIEAIKKAHLKTLQAVLISMCQSSSPCALEASRRLLTTRDQVVFGPEAQAESEAGPNTDDEDGEDGEDEGDEDEDDDEGETDDYAQRVAKRPRLDVDASDVLVRYETCYKCRQQFDVTRNGPDACHIHDGELDVNQDGYAWADDDHPPTPGVYDLDNQRVKDYPRGFIWDCCDGEADSMPCVTGRHEV